MTTEPEVTKLLPTPIWCAYVHEAPHPLATHLVDGTSVCPRHLAEAIVWARGKRAGR